jgi:ADP-heptose:LPS heptosyltransferase
MMMPLEETYTNRIVVLQTGGLGDLVLASELLCGLKKARPDAAVTLICKAGLAGIAGLYPAPPDEVIGLRFDPASFDSPTEELLDAVKPAVDELRERSAGALFVEATYHPSWFGYVAAAALRAERACCCTAVPKPEFLVPRVLEALALEPREVENVALPDGTHELERYRLLLRRLDVPPATVFPWVTPALDAEQGLRAREYLACFPGGSVGAEAKRWPLENFTRVLQDARLRWKLPVVLIGDTRERDLLQQLASSLTEPRGDVHLVTGGPDDLPRIASLMANARAYLGNDTGPLHIAAAYGVPGVAIYGGGHWPAYAPWAQGSVGLLHPLPCFGCDWDCLFGHGLCVDAIEPAVVEEALDAVLTGPAGAPRVQRVCRVTAETERWIALAAPRYRAAQQDRVQRWTQIMQQNVVLQKAEKSVKEASAEAQKREQSVHELTALVHARDLRIAELEGTAAERLASLEEMDAAVRERDARIVELERAAAERLEALETMDAAYKALEAGHKEIDREAELRLADVIKLTEWLQERDRRIAELEQAAAERVGP